MSRFVEDWTFWRYIVIWLPFFLFVVFYAWRSPGWWRSAVGRALMAVSASLVAILTLVLLEKMFDFPDAIWVPLLAITSSAISIAGFLLLFALLKEQRYARNHPDGQPRRRRGDHRPPTEE